MPVVTVAVITYNSAKFVAATLESVRQQFYPRIELIISDDCSTDATPEICRKWLDNPDNAGRFVSCMFVQTPCNAGISANYNNALRYAQGEWIKYIAGDDELLPECVEEYVRVAVGGNCKFWISGTIPFNEKDGDLPARLPNQALVGKDAFEQELLLLEMGTVIEGPTIFLETETLRKMGGIDEKYPFIEDYPLYMKYLRGGYKLGVIERPLIHYREYTGSVSRGGNSRFDASILSAIEDANIAAWLRRRKPFTAYHWLCNRWIRTRVRPPFSYLLRLTDIIGIRNNLKRER